MKPHFRLHYMPNFHQYFAAESITRGEPAYRFWPGPFNGLPELMRAIKRYMERSK